MKKSVNEPTPAFVRHSRFVIPSSFGSSSPAAAGHSSFRKASAFTIIELLIVITIIIILAALVLGTMGYVQKKAARSRAEAEIAGLSAACENYKADNGTYPTDPNGTSNNLDPKADLDAGSTKYQNASLGLYNLLAGMTNGSRVATGTAKSYFTFKPNMLYPTDQALNVTYIRDPFGNSYGYSTAYQADLTAAPTSIPTRGYNPTFDLWSTAAGKTQADTVQWIKNW